MDFDTLKQYAKQSKQMSFVKVDNNWWHWDETTPKDNAKLVAFGVKHQKSKVTNIEKLDIVKADDWYSLDWHGTAVLGDEFVTGWLLPDGTFFGCEYHLHDVQAHVVHRKEEREMEMAGCVKITYSPITKVYMAQLGMDDRFQTIRPTPQQMSYLASSYIDNLEDIKMQARGVSMGYFGFY